MAKILIIGHPDSPLENLRGLVGQRSGHHIYWFSVPLAALPDIEAFSVPAFARKSRMMSFFLKPLFLSLFMHRIKPDIVHVHYAQTGLMALPLSRSRRLIVSVMGGDILSDQEYRGVGAFAIRLLLDHASRITSKSDFMDKALDDIGNYRSRIRRITWGIDLSRFHPNRDVNGLRSRWSIPSDDLVFFDPRLARPFYNKHVILDAFAKYIKRGGKPATLLVASSFPDVSYVARLQGQAGSLGIGHKVRFVGSIPYEEMPDYYALADITISIPPSDGLPQTIHEAFACGSFLILSDLPQYADVVQDHLTACLVPTADENALANALHWAVSNPQVREEAKKLGRAYVQKHADFDTQAGLMNQIYAEVLEEADLA